MDFYSTLSSLGIRDMLKYVEYKIPQFSTTQKVRNTLQEIITSNARTLIYGDYDIDGLMCVKGMEASFRELGYYNFEIFPYAERTHNIDKRVIRMCIQEKFDYLIIMDTGSSELDLLNQLILYGVKVIVLDHHETLYTYSDFSENISFLNTTLENQLHDLETPDYELSAGALIFCVCSDLFASMEKTIPDWIAVYAVVSLYSDCMDMSNALNRSIYYVAMEVSKYEIPECISIFLGESTVFSRRFIEFCFAPRINSLFRSENLQLINRLFFDKGLDPFARDAIKNRVEDIYVTTRDLISEVSDLVDVREMTNFVLCDLGSVEENYSISKYKLYNYTGLIANQLCGRYGKPAIVYCEMIDCHKGSVRDQFGRNYLSAFRNISDAGGHNPAFGFRFSKTGLSKFIKDVERIDKYFSIRAAENYPIIIDYEFQEPDTRLIEDMAHYNDFSGSKIPVAFLRKQIIGAMKEHRSNYGYYYSWGSGYYISSKRRLAFGETVIIKPFVSKSTKLVVE